MTPVLPQILAQQTWDWGFVADILPDMARGLWVLVQITVLGLVVAMTLGLVFAILRRSRFRIVSWPVGLLVDFIRSTPLLVQFFFLFFAAFTPNSPLTLSGYQVGIIGLGIHYAAYTSESYRAGIESVARGQWEASTAINLTTANTWRSVILPQAIPTVIPALSNYLVAAFKDAPLASSIAVVELLGTARAIQGRFFTGLEPFTVAGIMFLAVSIPAAMFARYLEKRYGFQRE